MYELLPYRSPLRTLAGLLPIVMSLFIFPAGVSHSKNKQTASEYQIKAAYLYNFLLFTRWPALTAAKASGSGSESDGAVTIGIVGRDPFGPFFDEVEGRSIKMGDTKKKLVIRRFGPYNRGVDLKQCRLLFVSASEKSNLDEILGDVRGAPVLTVADFDGFLESGGMIRLVNVKEKIRWEINRGPIASAALRLDSMLLQSAVKVVDR